MSALTTASLRCTQPPISPPQASCLPPRHHPFLIKQSKVNFNSQYLGASKPTTASKENEDRQQQEWEELNKDHLKSAIRALNEKLKFFQNIETEKEIVAGQLKESD